TPQEVLTHQLSLYRPPGARSGKERRQSATAALTAVGLAEHAEKRIGRLSKGMQRRLAWALATIHKPEILILDEPASGLDPLGRRHLLDWIDGEKRRGATIVLCTHELPQVHALCDDFHILNRGKLVYSTLN